MALQRDKHKTALEMFSHSGEELLKTGIFSDAKITCGNREWAVHKIVICTRCSFFQKAFMGDFEEARTGVMKIQEMKPEEVDWVIKYLYTGKVSDELIKAQSIRKYAGLYTVADYFGVTSLQEASIDLVRTVLDSVAAKIQKGHTHYAMSPETYFSDRKMADFLHIAKIGYQTSSTSAISLQKTILGFLERTRFVVGKDARFSTHLRDVPELAVDMVQLLMQAERQGQGSLVCTDLPDKCSGCRKEGKTYARTWIRRVAMDGNCHSCEARNI